MNRLLSSNRTLSRPIWRGREKTRRNRIYPSIVVYSFSSKKRIVGNDSPNNYHDFEEFQIDDADIADGVYFEESSDQVFDPDNFDDSHTFDYDEDNRD